MAEFLKDSDEYKMFADYYNLTKKWYEGVRTIKEYDEFASDLMNFNNKYKDGKCALLTKKLALALNNYIDELYYAFKETLMNKG